MCDALGLLPNTANGSYQQHLRRLDRDECQLATKIDPTHQGRRYGIISESDPVLSTTVVEITTQFTKIKADPVLATTVAEITTMRPDGSDDRCYFSPRHVCQALGIDWMTQYRKVMADEVLATCMVEMTMEVQENQG